MFEGYIDFTLEHPKALSEVLWLGYMNNSFVLIRKGRFYSSFGWSEVGRANIPLEYDIKKNNKHVSIKHKLQNLVEIW
jgi:hypothetical protein